MRCLNCGFQNAKGNKFCSECGANLDPLDISQVSSPEKEIKPATPPDEQALFNRYLTPQLAHKVLATRGKIEGERRQVTALFVDIKGYTHLSETIGEEAIYRLMERMYEFMITAVYQEEGSVQKLTGDGIFALFGAPIALEDAPLRACRAALTIQQKMKALGDELDKEQNIHPMARIGIHTGPVVIGTVGTDMKMEFTAVGDTVNLASRMESIAEPGSVYISEATHTLAGPYIESSFVGEKQVKGKTELQKVYRVDGLKAHAVRFDISLRRGLTPLVGRAKELDALQEYFDIACKGATLLVQIIGEPGVGKSRLVHEWHNHIQNKRIFYLCANCMSFGQATSFLPFIEIVKSLFRINDIDDQKTVERKLMQGFELLGLDLQAKPFLLNLLSFPITDDSFKGLDAKLIGDRTREVLTAVLLNQCHLAPVVLAIEDLHWIDPASEQLLHHIISKENQMPLMILCTTRPAYQAPWFGGQSVKELRIASLSKDSAAHMIGTILGSERLSDEISRMIIDKTGCNPLFTEEMTRYLLDSGSLKRTGKTIEYQPATGKLNVPTTILDLLQARVDRLDETHKTLLQIAAVIGQRFSPELTRQVSGLNGSFDNCLKELEKQELIFPERVGDAIEYRFKHALLQDVIYDNLLKPQREKLHQSVAETIERLYPERLTEMAETLAQHWGNTRDKGKAVRYIAMAGEKSLRVYALAEAHERFLQAISLIDAAPGCVDDLFWADVILKWVLVFYYRTDYKGMLAALERYLPRMEAFGDKRRLSLFLYWLGFAHISGGRGASGKTLLERAKALGDEVNDAECIVLSSSGLIWLYSYWIPDGEKSDAMVKDYYEQAMKYIVKLHDAFFTLNLYFCMAIYAMQRSRYRESRVFCSKLMDLGRTYHDDRSFAAAYVGFAFCNNFEEQFQEALEQADRSLSLSPDFFGQLLARIAKAAAFALSGNIRESYEILKTAKPECEKNDFLLILGAVLIPLGAVTALNGQMAKGVAEIKAAMRYWASLGNYTQPVWGHVLLGDIYLQMAVGREKPPLGVILKNIGFILRTMPVVHRKARHHLEEVVRKSKECNMPGFLAKALYGLGVLSQAKKKHSEARSYFEEALKVAEGSQLYIAGKIKSALSSMAV